MKTHNAQHTFKPAHWAAGAVLAFFGLLVLAGGFLLSLGLILLAALLLPVLLLKSWLTGKPLSKPGFTQRIRIRRVNSHKTTAANSTATQKGKGKVLEAEYRVID